MSELVDIAKVSVMVQHAIKYLSITGELPKRNYFVKQFNQPRELVDQVYIKLALFVPSAILQQNESEATDDK